jgi:hypothetical protein
MPDLRFQDHFSLKGCERYIKIYEYKHNNYTSPTHIICSSLPYLMENNALSTVYSRTKIREFSFLRAK